MTNAGGNEGWYDFNGFGVFKKYGARFELPWKLFFFLFISSYPLAIAAYLLKLSFVWLTLPIVIAQGFPPIFVGAKVIFRRWEKVSTATKVLTVVCFLYGLNLLGFPFIRLGDPFFIVGLSIALIIGYCLSILVLAVVLEEEETQRRLYMQELHTANTLQMSLMPTKAPQLTGIVVAGQCLPATEVGGDIFQYYNRNDKFTVALGDVTGHGMQAAVPVMTFSGILDTEMKYGHSLEDLFANLNATLYASLERRTYVCFAMGEIDLSTYTLHLSDCGLPYPCHFKASDQTVAELPVNAFPLGIRPDTTYESIEIQLEPDDRVLFFSDGLVEAANPQREIFGFERVVETIRQGCVDGLSAEALKQHIYDAVKTFSGDAPQEDDQTLVVVHVGPQA